MNCSVTKLNPWFLCETLEPTDLPDTPGIPYTFLYALYFNVSLYWLSLRFGPKKVVWSEISNISYIDYTSVKRSNQHSSVLHHVLPGVFSHWWIMMNPLQWWLDRPSHVMPCHTPRNSLGPPSGRQSTQNCRGTPAKRRTNGAPGVRKEISPHINQWKCRETTWKKIQQLQVPKFSRRAFQRLPQVFRDPVMWFLKGMRPDQPSSWRLTMINHVPPLDPKNHGKMKVWYPRIPRNMGKKPYRFVAVVGSHKIRCIQTCHISSFANIEKLSLHLPFVQFFAHQPLEVVWEFQEIPIMRVLPLPSLNKTIKTFLITSMYHEAHASSSSSSSFINGWPSYPTPLNAKPLRQQPNSHPTVFVCLPWMPVEVIARLLHSWSLKWWLFHHLGAPKQNQTENWGRIGHKYDCCKRERPSKDPHGSTIPYTRIIKMHLSQVNLNTLQLEYHHLDVSEK